MMKIHYQNHLETIQGTWKCTSATNQLTEESIDSDFSLLISENLISRIGNNNQYWPSICSFDAVGTFRDTYYYREDGCFMQIKSLTDKNLLIELSYKKEDGQLNVFIFKFDKEAE